MLSEALRVVGKVLPLIIYTCGRSGIEAHIIAALGGVSVEGKVGGRLTGSRQPVTETRGECEILDRFEVGVDGSVYVESTVFTNIIVAHDHRMKLLAGIIFGHCIVVAVLVFEQVFTIIQSSLHVSRQLIRCVGIGRKRVQLEDRG